MTDFKVDHEALLHLASRLGAIKTSLDGTKEQVFRFDGYLGSADLKDEMHHFIDNWSQGRDQIDQDIKACNQYLQGAGTAYQTNEKALADKFNGTGAGS